VSRRGALLGAVLGVACAGEPAPAGAAAADTGAPVADSGGPADPLADWQCTPDDTVTWGGFTDGFFSAYCRACHSATTPDRRGAPEGVDFSDRAEALSWAPRLKARVLDAGDMPLGGGVVDEDLSRFEGWLCHQVQRDLAAQGAR
jgi:hypothetical protein